MMDAVFGTDNFRNEIVWCYRGAGYPKKILEEDMTLFSDIVKEQNISLIWMMLERNTPKPQKLGLSTILETKGNKGILDYKN